MKDGGCTEWQTSDMSVADILDMASFSRAVSDDVC